MNVRVSVVIPAYNCEAYLAEALESAFAQTRAADEILVVDDGSQDATATVAARYTGRIALFRQERGGIGAARNLGITKATGTHIAFLDADDRWLPEKIERQLAALEDQPWIDMNCTGVRQFYSPEINVPEEERVRLSLQPTQGMLPGSLLAKASAFAQAGLFRTDTRMGEFVDWYARAVEAGLRSAVLPEVLLERRIHNTNTGVLERPNRSDYARVLKAALDRRRAMAAGSSSS